MSEADDHQPAQLTPERLAKGDIEQSLYANGSLRYASAVNLSILSVLVERARLEDAAVSTARTFMDWRDAHNARVEGRIYVNEHQGAPGEYTKADRYKLLIRLVPRRITDLVLLACDPGPGPHALSAALKDPSEFQTAFEWTDRAIREILKDYDDVFARLAVRRGEARIPYA